MTITTTRGRADANATTTARGSEDGLLLRRCRPKPINAALPLLSPLLDELPTSLYFRLYPSTCSRAASTCWRKSAEVPGMLGG